jgi:hypothetical protein
MMLDGTMVDVINGKAYNNFNIENSRWTFLELFNGFTPFIEFMRMFRVSAEWVENEIKNDPHISLNELFEYTLNKTPFLEDKDGALVHERQKGIDGRLHTVHVKKNVYVNSCHSSYVVLHIIAEKAMKFHFPKMFEPPFVKTVKINEEILNISMDMRIRDYKGDSRATFKDIFDIINGEKTEETITKFAIYPTGEIFIQVTPDYSLSMVTFDFFIKNWTAVSKRNIFSVPKENPTPNDRWYEGEQGKYFAFKNEIVEEVRKAFFI